MSDAQKRGPGRPPKRDGTALIHPLMVRHTEAQHQDLLRRAAAAGMGPVEFVRSMVWPE